MQQSHEALSSYMRRIRGVRRVSAEDEGRLVRRWVQHGDLEASRALLEAHLPLVVRVAMKYRGYPVGLEDLVAEGNLGLIRALQSFEDRGVPFRLYATYWVRAYILNYVLRNWSVLGSNSGVSARAFFKLRAERARLEAQYGQNAERVFEGLALSLNMNEELVRDVSARLQATSVSMVTGESEDAEAHRSKGDELACPRPDPELRLLSSEEVSRMKVAVRTVLKKLDPRERLLLEERLLRDEEDQVTLAELGRRLGISRERARQIEVGVKRKLRRAVQKMERPDSGRGARITSLGA